MKIDKIKPIPKYILNKIKLYDREFNPTPNSNRRFYAYFTKNDGELVKVTVAVKHYKGKLYCKQVLVHGTESKYVYGKDIAYYTIAGYIVGWHSEGIQRYQKHFEDNSWGVGCNLKFEPYVPVVNKEYALKFPKYKYSAVDKYPYADVLKYLKLYEKYPQAEYLVKGGYHRLATSKMILQKMKKDKSFHRWLTSKNKYFMENHYYIETILEGYKTRRPLDELQEFISQKRPFMLEKDYKPLKTVFKGKTLERFFNYIKEQKTQIRTYLDYFNACTDLQLDMTRDKNLFPHDFKFWHDTRIEEAHMRKAEIDERKRQEMFKSFGIIANKYLPLQEFSKNGYVVIIAKSPAELESEGEFLHHCVGRGTYSQKFLKEQSLIFFIRKKKNPNTPIATLEYSLEKRQILQCRGDHNKTPQKSLLNFVNDMWLPYANQQLKQITA